MKMTMIGLAVVLLAPLYGTAQPSCMTGGDDEALDRLLLLRFAKDADLGGKKLLDVMAGYAEFHEALAAMQAKRDALASDLETAVNEGKSSSEVTAKLNLLMRQDEQMFQARQDKVGEAGMLLTPPELAKLYLLVSDMDGQRRQARMALRGMPCPMLARTAPESTAAPASADPKQAVKDTVKVFLDKLVAKDLDGALAGLSADFSNYNFGDKAGLRQFLQDALDTGYLDDIQVSMDKAEIDIDGKEGTVYPVKVEGMFGTVTLELAVKKEGEVWRLVGMEASGL